MPPSKRIFVGGLKSTIDETILQEYFSKYGEIEHIDLPEDKESKRKRGFAYVAFTDSDSVDKATSKFILTEILSRGSRVYGRHAGDTRRLHIIGSGKLLI